MASTGKQTKRRARPFITSDLYVSKTSLFCLRSSHLQSEGRIKRCQSWNDAAEFRSTPKRYLMTSWKHAASKAVAIDEFDALIAETEVLRE